MTGRCAALFTVHSSVRQVYYEVGVQASMTDVRLVRSAQRQEVVAPDS